MGISMLVRHFLGLLLLSVGVWSFTAPPYDPSPFQMIGFISGMTANDITKPLAGGVLTLNGIPITIPDNTLVTLPSITVAWNELFSGPTTPDLPFLGQNGITWEANVLGNRVGDTYIAGLVYITQQSLQSLNGFITSIDPTTGKFTVAGSFGGTHAGSITAILNDPSGRYGPKYTDNPLWTIDPDNPSIHATTGFPLCIQGDKTNCPDKNRPTDGAGNPVTKIQFGDPALAVNSATLPDPNLFVPLRVGDYITFSGIEVGGATNSLIAVYVLEANLGIYTAPGKTPAYVTCESVNYGVVTNQGGENAETRAVAFTTDPTTSIQWFAQDVDPCTGVVTERNLLLMQPNNVAPIGRAVFRLGKVDASPPTRQVGFRLSTGNVTTVTGLNAGLFVQPVFDFIFPELLTFGDPMFTLAFDAIPFLAKGGGPFIPGKPDATPPAPAVRVGQLTPWPGAPVPAGAGCTGPVVLPIPGSGSTSTPPPPPPPPPPPKEVITINSATKRNQRGSTTVSVTASDNNFAAKLSLAIGGVNPVPAQAMISQGNGVWQLSVAVKGAPNLVTVTSDKGASASKAI